MKSTSIRILTILLCLVLTLGLCVSAVQAAPAETHSVSDQPITEATAAAMQEGQSMRLALPSIKPTLSSGVKLPDAEITEKPELSAPSVFHTNFQDTVTEAREAFKQRKYYIEVGYKSTQNISATIVDSLLDGIIQHTGVPTEGDYIDWNVADWGVDGSVSYKDGYYLYSIWFIPRYYASAKQELEVDAAVSALLSQLNVYNASDYQKVKTVYDYMCKNIVYDHYGLSVNDLYCHSTHSAIIEKKTVCQGYASLFYRLMLELNVNVRLIAGDANTVPTGPNNGDDEHGWNIVKLNGKWYNLDSTWDAQSHPDGQNYEYFLVCDANFPEHQPWEQYRTEAFISNYPKATSNYVPAGEWVLIGGKWHYQNNGKDVTGWQSIDGKWYFFNSDGSMKTGWLQQGTKWYYLNSSGAMVTGTVTIGGKQNKFDANGVWLGEVTLNGWVQQSGVWYYYKNGVKATGWQSIGGKWYFFNSNGSMKTGWLQQGTKWYYLNSSGAMVTGTVTIGGKQNKFDANGVWQGEVQTTQNGWVQKNGKWYYYENGVKITTWKIIDGKTYCFNSDGSMHTGWKYMNAEWYYFGSDGAMYVGLCLIGGYYYGFEGDGSMIIGWGINYGTGDHYYFDSEGRMLRNCSRTINGKTYYFNNEGVCTNY